MKGDPLNPSDSFGRFCKKSQIFETGEVSSAAFRLRHERNEEYLSGACLEKYAEESLDTRHQGLRESYARLLSFKVRDRFAILKVQHTIDEVQQHTEGRVIRFLHEPEPDHDAHSGIHDTAQDEERISEIIAKAVQYTITAIP